MDTAMFNKNERPPDKTDADVQGCVLGFDELAGSWRPLHWENMQVSWINWWMHMPPRPEALRRA